VPKQRKATPATLSTQGRFHLGRRSLFLLLAAAVLAFGLTEWWPQGKHPSYRTLTQIVATAAGFELAESPDRPGPYQQLGTCSTGIGEPAIGSFWANGKTCRFHIRAVPGEELRVICLLPQDSGGPTYVVLKRHIAPKPPAGEPKK